ncbi:MAG: carbohydrate ABC transporter permease [Bacillota bacterium]
MAETTPAVRSVLSARQVRVRYWQQELTGLAFVAPWVIGFLLLTLFPMAQSLWLAFTSYDLLTPPRWIGLANFQEMISDPRFHKALSVTLRYVVISVPLRLTVALAIAMLLAQKIRGVGLYRVIYYIPSLIGSSVAVAIMWRRIFAKEGLVNSFLGLFGIQGLDWITHPTFALYTLAGLSAWQFGSSMVIFLAGLKQVPAELYEASAVDGANRWQQFLRITLPMLSPVILFNLVMQTIQGFQVFTQGFLITRGGPMDETRFYALYLYEKGFESFQMGYASALAWVLLIMIATSTALIFKLTGRFVHYEADTPGR